MKHKKRFICAFAIIALILGMILFYTLSMKKVKIETYDKYTMTVHINAIKKDGKKEAKIISLNFDGDVANISLVPDAIEYNAYLIGNTIYYQKGDLYSKIEVQYKYTDLYDYIKNLQEFDREKTDDKEVYYILLKKDSLTKILECLHFEKKNAKPVQGQLTLKQNKISSFNIKLGEISDYKELEININFNNLKEEFKINVPKEMIEKSTETNIFPFSIIK